MRIATQMRLERLEAAERQEGVVYVVLDTLPDDEVAGSHIMTEEQWQAECLFAGTPQMKRATLSRIERLEMKAATSELKPILNVSVLVRAPESGGDVRIVPFAEWQAARCRAKEQR